MVKEKEIVPKVKKFFGKRGYKTYREVRIKRRRMDLVCLEGNELVAIEVKVKNWKRALQQAVVYRLCADKVWVSIWHKNVHNIEKGLFDKYGIGVLNIKKEGIRVVKKPKKVKIVDEYVQKQIINRLEREENERHKTLLSFSYNG